MSQTVIINVEVIEAWQKAFKAYRTFIHSTCSVKSEKYRTLLTASLDALDAARVETVERGLRPWKWDGEVLRQAVNLMVQEQKFAYRAKADEHDRAIMQGYTLEDITLQTLRGECSDLCQAILEARGFFREHLIRSEGLGVDRES